MLHPSLRLGKRIVRKGICLADEFLKTHPKLRECNVCGWSGRRFESDSWHPNTVCPMCRSEVRHRLLAAALSHTDRLGSQRILHGKAVLHFAPEAVIGNILRKSAGIYVTADLLRKDVDMKLDMSNMVSVEADKFDVVVACDVLEHVPDDKKAMREIYRVLRTRGYAIVTVPQKDDLQDTFEDKTVIDPAERERLYGQWDHVRIYGKTFPEILESVGFEVTTIDEKSFSNVMTKRSVLFPPALSKHPLATNYRKVFFAQKKDL